MAVTCVVSAAPAKKAAQGTQLRADAEAVKPPAEQEIKRASEDLGRVGEEGRSAELIEATLQGASEKLLAVLRVLARRPGEWLSVNEIAADMPKVDRRGSGDSPSIGGVLGGSATKAKRLGMKRGLLDVRYRRDGHREYRMDERTAAVVAAIDAGVS
jgi:hypothetical protein